MFLNSLILVRLVGVEPTTSFLSRKPSTADIKTLNNPCNFVIASYEVMKITTL